MVFVAYFLFFCGIFFLFGRHGFFVVVKRHGMFVRLCHNVVLSVVPLCLLCGPTLSVCGPMLSFVWSHVMMDSYHTHR